MKKKNIILAILIAFILLFGIALSCSAQIYYSDISKKEYNKIVSGQMFYPAKVLYNNDSVAEGFVARFNNSDLIRFRKSMDDDNIKTLSPRHIKAFMYGNPEWDYPQYVFKNIDMTKKKKRPKIRALEVVSKGDIMIYIHKWVEEPDMPMLPFSKAYCSVNTLFYLEKDGVMYEINDWNQHMEDLIEDKEEVFMEYKKNYRKEYRDTSDFKNFVNLINFYNETE